MQPVTLDKEFVGTTLGLCLALDETLVLMKTKEQNKRRKAAEKALKERQKEARAARGRARVREVRIADEQRMLELRGQRYGVPVHMMKKPRPMEERRRAAALRAAHALAQALE